MIFSPIKSTEEAARLKCIRAAHIQWTTVQPYDEPAASHDLAIELGASAITFEVIVYCTTALRLLGGEGTVGVVLVPTP